MFYLQLENRTWIGAAQFKEINKLIMNNRFSQCVLSSILCGWVYLGFYLHFSHVRSKFDENSILVGPPTLPRCPMSSALSARPSIRLCNTFFSELVYYFFLGFYMTGFNKLIVMERFFFKENCYNRNMVNGKFFEIGHF